MPATGHTAAMAAELLYARHRTGLAFQRIADHGPAGCRSCGPDVTIADRTGGDLCMNMSFSRALLIGAALWFVASLAMRLYRQ